MTMPPSKLRVGAREYTVHTDETSYLKMVESQRKDNEAYTNHPSESIVLRPGRTANWTAESLLHEGLHCVLGFNGVDLANVEGKVEDLEEYLVSFMSPILLMLLRDNPQLVEFLQTPEVPWEPDPTLPSAGSPGEAARLMRDRGRLVAQGVPKSELRQVLCAEHLRASCESCSEALG